MKKLLVAGPTRLSGTVRIHGAKNSVLPLLAAALLCRGTVRLRAVPALSDVECCLALLRGAGCDARRQGADVVVSGTPVCSTLPGDAAARMRASILFCAPLLARLGRAETSLPGGCPIGQRPIDLHLEGLGRMGAKELDAGAGRLVLAAPGGLYGADFTSVSPAWGLPRPCCWPLSVPGAPRCCGGLRGSRKYPTSRTSSAAAADRSKGRGHLPSASRGGGRSPAAIFRLCPTASSPPRLPAPLLQPEGGWNWQDARPDSTSRYWKFWNKWAAP